MTVMMAHWENMKVHPSHFTEWHTAMYLSISTGHLCISQYWGGNILLPATLWKGPSPLTPQSGPGLYLKEFQDMVYRIPSTACHDLEVSFIRRKMPMPLQTPGSEKSPVKFTRPKKEYHQSPTWRTHKSVHFTGMWAREDSSRKLESWSSLPLELFVSSGVPPPPPPPPPPKKKKKKWKDKKKKKRLRLWGWVEL